MQIFTASRCALAYNNPMVDSPFTGRSQAQTIIAAVAAERTRCATIARTISDDEPQDPAWRACARYILEHITGPVATAARLNQ